MEHAADALKMAFALLVFAIAITTVFVMVAKVKTTSDKVMYYGDKTNFYAHYSDPKVDATSGNRIVGISDILATLYRYYKESVAVTVILEENNPEKIYYFDLGYEQMGVVSGKKVLLVKDGNNKELLKLSTQEDIEKNLGIFIWENLIKNSTYNTAKFTERFTEVPTSGIYDKGDDGSEIVLSSGGKKVYITYTIIK